MSFLSLLRLSRREVLLLSAVYLLSLGLRLLPKLATDPHLPAFQADVWYRIAMAQYILDHRQLPEPDLRYRAYGYVPMWYPPLSPLLLALGSRVLGVDIPVLCTRVVPFLEALTPLPIYFLTRHLAGRCAATAALLVLALTPSFVYWTGVADPQSFTIFMLPLYLLYWHWYSASPSPRRLLPLGVVLGLNFLLHLSYFLALLALLMYTLGMGAGRSRLLRDLGVVILISQAIAAPWWLPRNLYWWWTEVLVTSSGLYSPARHLREYGTVAALLGAAGMLYLLRSRNKPVLLWALPLFLETQNETILQLLGMSHLSWETLAKPLEGFRFYPFLAQPAAVAAGMLLAEVWRRKRVACLFLLLILAADLWAYGLGEKLTRSGITVEEYRAALWYRENAGEDGRIIADYYRAQMFAGVSGGRALLGGVFPLRSVDYPYVSVPARVQDDLYLLYSTPSAKLAWEIARKYNATHIYYSVWMRRAGNLVSSRNPAAYGVEVSLSKFFNTTYFRRVYSAPGVSIFYVVPEPEHRK